MPRAPEEEEEDLNAVPYLWTRVWWLPGERRIDDDPVTQKIVRFSTIMTLCELLMRQLVAFFQIPDVVDACVDSA